MSFKLAAVAAAVAATLALAACGGGGGGGGALPIGWGNGVPPPPAPAPAPPPAPSPAPAPAPTPAPAPAPATRTFMYEALPPAADAAALLDRLNAQGARSFRFFSGLAFTASPTSVEVVEAYVKDAGTTYAFELLPNAGSVAEFQDQLNAQGARGFKWGGPYVVGGQIRTFYRKDNGSASTYTYAVLTAPADSAGYLSQVNAQGGNGYYSVGGAYMVGGTTVLVYQKDAQGSATYGYEALGQPGNDADFLAQFEAQGARGFRFKTGYVFSDGTKLLYEKDLSQAATFTYQNLQPAANSADYIAQANAEGAKGNALVGDYMLPSGQIRTLYIRPANCSGFLCDTRSLFGF
ncbi:hypothetical protein J7E49_23845 [Variovorax paradoxus]|nr:hypothetical protein [Variovorax paradoxus]